MEQSLIILKKKLNYECASLQLIAAVFHLNVSSQSITFFKTLINNKCFHKYEFASVRSLQDLPQDLLFIKLNRNKAAFSHFHKLIKIHQSTHYDCLSLSSKKVKLSAQLFYKKLFSILQKETLNIPNNIELKYLMSLLYTASFNPKRSNQLLDNILNLCPQHTPYLLLNKFNNLYQLNLHSQAIICLKQALRWTYLINDSGRLKFQILKLKCKMLFNQCDYQSALNLLQKPASVLWSTDQNTGNLFNKCFYQNSKTLSTLGQTSNQLIAYFKPKSMQNIYTFLKSVKPEQQILQYVSEVFDTQGQSSQYFISQSYFMAIAQTVFQDYKKASYYCQRAWPYHRKNIKFCRFAAQVFLRTANQAMAEECLRQMESHCPLNFEGKAAIIQTLMLTGQKDEAFRLALILKKDFKKSINNYVKIIELFDFINEPSEVLNLIAQLHNTSVQQHKQQGLCLKIRVLEFMNNYKIGYFAKSTYLFNNIFNHINIKNEDQIVSLLYIVHFCYVSKELYKGRKIMKALYAVVETSLQMKLWFFHHLNRIRFTRKIIA